MNSTAAEYSRDATSSIPPMNSSYIPNTQFVPSYQQIDVPVLYSGPDAAQQNIYIERDGKGWETTERHSIGILCSLLCFIFRQNYRVGPEKLGWLWKTWVALTLQVAAAPQGRSKSEICRQKPETTTRGDMHTHIHIFLDLRNAGYVCTHDERRGRINISNDKISEIQIPCCLPHAMICGMHPQVQ